MNKSILNFFYRHGSLAPPEAARAAVIATVAANSDHKMAATKPYKNKQKLKCKPKSERHFIRSNPLNELK